MKVVLSKPSPMEARTEDPSSGSPHDMVQLEPIRRSKKQQNLPTIPYTVLSDNGTVLDSGMITVNQRTGRLSVDHQSTGEIPIEADRL